MNIATVRLGKELRVLIWPWLALMLIGATFFLPIGGGRVAFSFKGALVFSRFVGFWLGLPLLATLSLGHEFQHRTASLLFAQPIGRLKIWREKWLVLAPLMATAAVLYIWTDGSLGVARNFGVPRAFSVHLDWQAPILATAWIVTAAWTAPFWTLIGRSILNGFILNLIQGFALYQIWLWVNSIFDAGHWLHEDLGVVCAIAATAYAFLILWLGRRKFVRFEVAGGSGSADLLGPGSRGATRSSGLLRSRPGQPVLNLIRKEIRLLWLIWFLAIATVLGVLCLSALRFAPGYSRNDVGLLVSSFVLALSSLSAILAGSLSMGEERTSGTQSWHRTLPVSGTTQWLVKLGVVLGVSFVAAVLPAIAAKLAVGEDLGVPLNFGYQNHVVFSLFVFSSLFSFAGFWCACLVKGTIRAALLTIPAIAFVLVGLEPSISLINLLHFSRMLDPLVLRFHPFPFPGEQGFGYFGKFIAWLIVPALLVAVFQSYRLFRREAHERFAAVLRPLLEVALAVYVFGVVLGIPSAVVTRASQLSFQALSEANEAIGRMPRDMISVAGNPKQLSLEDITKAGALSDSSRFVLRDAVIFTSPERGRWGTYVAAIRFRNGLMCTTTNRYRCEMQTGK